jgi:hypothetical protein
MWVLLALGAGLLQSAQNGFARSLVGSISPVLYSLLIWKESEVSRQVPGMALTLVGIVLVLLGGSPA